MELKLTQVARASLEELRLDYEDFLRHRSLPQWPPGDPRRADLVARRCATADEVAAWARELSGRSGLVGGGETDGRADYPEISANAALVLVNVACALLERQVASLAASFESEGGFTERLYRIRSARRGNPPEN